MKKYILFFGPPGSGKGTQADMLAAELGLPILSPGELLRHEEEEGSELGKKIAPLIDSGQMVPDEMVEEMVRKRLVREDAAKGAVLDGYPRSVDQLKALLEEFISGGAKSCAVLIEADDDEVMKRLSGRRVCDCGASYHLVFNPPKVPDVCDLCGKELEIRHDDKPEIMARRLEAFHAGIQTLAAYWADRNSLLRIDGTKPINEVHELIKKGVSGLMA